MEHNKRTRKTGTYTRKAYARTRTRTRTNHTSTQAHKHTPQAHAGTGQHIPLHFEHAVVNLQNADIKRAAAEIVHRHGLALLAGLQAVGERRRRGLVDNALNETNVKRVIPKYV